jgi:hypothetical protein
VLNTVRNGLRRVFEMVGEAVDGGSDVGLGSAAHGGRQEFGLLGDQDDGQDAQFAGFAAF